MIAICIPTIRPESFDRFKEAWHKLFIKHGVKLVTVWDGEEPMVDCYDYALNQSLPSRSLKEVMGKYSKAIVNFNGGVRNLGFAYIAKYLPDVEIILTLDDDVKPIGDTIRDHLKALGQHVPVSWVSTASEYMRGFPYKIRNEAEVVLSHGVWEGVADFDAPTQLVKGSHRPVEFPKMPIPKSIYFPMCIMNVAFRRKLLPYMYQAPLTKEIGRADDIFCGILAKREIDVRGWAAVTGYARVHHERESDVYKNLNLESKTIELMETFWQGDESDPYFRVYHDKRVLWNSFLRSLKI